MSYLQLIFGKEIDQLVIDDIVSYFAHQREESNKLEFKSFVLNPKSRNDLEEKESKIMKTLSAFLNSDGGILIWGAPETTKVGTKSVCVGALKPVDKQYDKDQIMDMIANTIIPAPQGITFKTFLCQSGFVYLFDAPRSSYAPHQYKDTYYMRMDGQTKAAPHHYIEALFKKIDFPNLEAYLRLDSFEHVDHDAARLTCSIIFRNQTPFRNDYNLHYRIFSSHGLITTAWEQILFSPKDPRLLREGDYANPRVAETIYYGNWIDDRLTIFLSRSRLHQENYQLNIRLQFGAKHSPMKICLYEIVIGEKMNSNLQNHIVDMSENRLFNIHEETMGETDQVRLNRTLGRS